MRLILLLLFSLVLQFSFASSNDSLLKFDVSLNHNKLKNFTERVANIIALKEKNLKSDDTLSIHFYNEHLPDNCTANIIVTYGSPGGVGYPIGQNGEMKGDYLVSIQKIRNIPSMNSKVFYVNYVVFKDGKYIQWRTLFTIKFK